MAKTEAGAVTKAEQDFVEAARAAAERELGRLRLLAATALLWLARPVVDELRKAPDGVRKGTQVLRDGTSAVTSFLGLLARLGQTAAAKQGGAQVHQPAVREFFLAERYRLFARHRDGRLLGRGDERHARGAPVDEAGRRGLGGDGARHECAVPDGADGVALRAGPGGRARVVPPRPPRGRGA